MASVRGIANALGILAETFATREISKRTADVWATVFADVDDESLGRAVLRLVREPGRTYFPSSGEVFAALAKDAKPVDMVRILHRIEQLGHYDPHVGWVYPTDAMIREKLGDAIADAYTMAGRERVFAAEEKDGNTITRDIARRKFGEEIEEAQRLQPSRPLLVETTQKHLPPLVPEAPPPRVVRQLKPGQPTPLADTVGKAMQEITVEPKTEAVA